jgi:hypothetical protein
MKISVSTKNIIIRIISAIFLALNLYWFIFLTFFTKAPKKEISETFQALEIELPMVTKLFFSIPYYFYIIFALILIVKEWWYKKKLFNLIINIGVFLFFFLFYFIALVLPMYQMLGQIK